MHIRHKDPMRICISFFSIMLLALFSQVVQAVSLRIDPTASHVTYTQLTQICTTGPQGEVLCPPLLSETFSLAGNVDVGVTHEHWEFDFGYPTVDRDLIRLQTSGLISGALSKGFSLFSVFPTLGLLSGNTFDVSDEPCFLFVGPGSCSGGVIGDRTGSTGTWDGTTLLWSGFQGNWWEEFTFSLRATAVPEPSTISLLLLTLCLTTFTVRGKRNPSERT